MCCHVVICDVSRSMQNRRRQPRVQWHQQRSRTGGHLLCRMVPVVAATVVRYAQCCVRVKSLGVSAPERVSENVTLYGHWLDVGNTIWISDDSPGCKVPVLGDTRPRSGITCFIVQLNGSREEDTLVMVTAHMVTVFVMQCIEPDTASIGCNGPL